MVYIRGNDIQEQMTFSKLLSSMRTSDEFKKDKLKFYKRERVILEQRRRFDEEEYIMKHISILKSHIYVCRSRRTLPVCFKQHGDVIPGIVETKHTFTFDPNERTNITTHINAWKAQLIRPWFQFDVYTTFEKLITRSITKGVATLTYCTYELKKIDY
jgi:hypothetical protein